MYRPVAIRLATAIALVGIGHAVQAATIPEQFQGFWEKKDFCPTALELGMPNTGLVIREDSILGYEQPCDLESIQESGDTVLNATFECTFPDGSEVMSYRFEKVSSEKLMYASSGFQSDALVRCPAD